MLSIRIDDAATRLGLRGRGDLAGGAGTPPGSSAGGRAGFSLVEMLVVLAILALATSIGIPSIAGIVPSRRLNAAAEAVAGELSLLRTEAVRTGSNASLVLDAPTGRLLSTRPGAPALLTEMLQVRVDTSPTGRANPGEIRFLPSGSSTGGRITLAGPGGSQVLVVGRATGAVRRVEAQP